MGYKNPPKKRFGQNFLQDESVIRDILLEANIGPDDTVLEIGPGRGALTSFMAKSAGHLFAVEIDKDLVGPLEDTYSSYENVTIIEGDILKIDLEAILAGRENIKVVANLPYYITTPIIMMLLESKIKFSCIIVMVQKEVALRLCGDNTTSDYGAISLAVSFYTNSFIVREVPAHCFYPAPKVDSAVVRLEPTEPPCEGIEKKHFFTLVKAAFSQRRKTLVNCLSFAGIGDKETIKKSLLALGFKDNVRGEELSLSDFLALSERIWG